MFRSIVDRIRARRVARTAVIVGLTIFCAMAAEQSTKAGIVHAPVGETISVLSGNTSYSLNVGGVQFQFSSSSTVVINSGSLIISTAPGAGGSVFGSSGAVTPLPVDTVINASLSPGSFAAVSQTIGIAEYKESPTDYSGFINLGDRFIGIQLSLNDGIHYGWIKVNNTVFVTGDGITNQSLLISEFAYETRAGVSLKAGQIVADTPSVPEPASLVQLAMGVAGLGSLAALRRRGRDDNHIS